ncbi:MAG: hypothetical protein HKN25_03340 [Pyrinomonadaceae bacterium]|nr:hypothetical protein [Pyrinomonadaceae bacterium]
MKYSVITTFLLILCFAFSAVGQDLSRLKKLSKDLKRQSEDLVERTQKDLKKSEMRTQIEIESAFMANQLYSSTVLIGRLIKQKYHVSEIRYAGMVLSDMAKRFPLETKHAFEWKKSKDIVSEMSRELRGLNAGVIETENYEVDEEKILGKTFWSGMVDDDVQILVQGSMVTTKTITGQAKEKGLFSFTSALPQQSRIRVGVRKKSGRGKVHVVQQPDESNDYTAIIEVKDEEGGARAYSLEIYWYRR